jgi:bacillithiol system protein YtxJ
MIMPCRDENDFNQIVNDCVECPTFLFKHSTRCPVSARAHAEFTRFADENPEIACREVLVIEQRPLSQFIARQTGVAHQSPQALLFSGGSVVWRASHYDITADALLKASDLRTGSRE